MKYALDRERFDQINQTDQPYEMVAAPASSFRAFALLLGSQAQLLMQA